MLMLLDIEVPYIIYTTYFIVQYINNITNIQKLFKDKIIKD